MKSKRNLILQLNSLPYFNKETICQLSKQLGLKNATIDTYISRLMRQKEIIQLKKGLYVATDFFNKNKGDASYIFYLANILRTPSYVSSWAALQHYNLTTESIYTTTSVTLKVTRSYNTKAGNFTFQTIKKDLFSDFSLIKGKFNFFIASPSKAIFDLLYFKTFQFRSVSFKDIKLLVEELRIDIDEMDKEEKAKFNTLIKSHIL